MTESVSFKAYLKRDGQEVEVRRFGIDGGAATNFLYLRGKIVAMFPSIQNDEFIIFWQDSDKDYIIIGSDEELLEALAANTEQPFKLYVHTKPQQQRASQGNPTKQSHPGVSCDGCEGPVTGYRYKCVTCSDYDLCAACEAAGKHSAHIMLRMPFPLNGSHCPRFFRKFFGRPHKFNKRYGFHMGEDAHGPAGAGQCPYSRRDGPVPPMAGGVGMPPDMFNFSALMEFINGLVEDPAGGESAVDKATARAQTTCSSSAQPGPAASSQGASQSTAAGHEHRPAEYLTNIGHAISALLNPMGVDVTFDVRTKPGGTQEPATAPTPQQSAPAPAPQQSVPAPVAPQTTPTANPVAEAVTIPATTPENPPATQAKPVHESSPSRPRRNSDDWTLLNRESPTRGDEVAMDVDESRGVKQKILYPELPSAPPQASSVAQDSERQRIQEAVDNIRAMGFDYETTLLRELLRRENGDIASVLENILSNGKK